VIVDLVTLPAVTAASTNISLRLRYFYIMDHTDEDEIDTEALQAQIDLSMSFAENLVSSWVKTSRKLPSRSRDVEAELREYMRRPPR